MNHTIAGATLTVDFGHFTLKLTEFETTSKLLPNEIREFADHALMNNDVEALSDEPYHQMYTSGGKVWLDVFQRLNPYWDCSNHISVGLMPNEACYLADAYEEYLNDAPARYVYIYDSRKSFGFPLTEDVVQTLASRIPKLADKISADKK